MGRSTSARGEKELTDLAEWLRSLRQRSGLPYGRMALKSRVIHLPASTAAFCRADKGRTLPPWEVVEAYTRCCNGSVAEARRRWRCAANAAEVREINVRVPKKAPALAFIIEPAELLMAMRELRVAAGKPSLRALERKALVPGGGGSYLPHSTISAVLNGTRACSSTVLWHYVTACGVTGDEDRRQWLEAARRVERYHGKGAASHFSTAS
ncbi:hypothetical protein ACFXCZ_32005 [Streptomyces sp. NPDC059396]|uniref:hypothetical protein n=1 Tax=Streptomyces sp. NPDC059396 TaxID=3346819 RepID=UPI0036AC2D0B